MDVPLKVGCYLNRLGEGDFSAQDGIENGFSKIGCHLFGWCLFGRAWTPQSTVDCDDYGLLEQTKPSLGLPHGASNQAPP
jgi:hypothetical protein